MQLIMKILVYLTAEKLANTQLTYSYKKNRNFSVADS